MGFSLRPKPKLTLYLQQLLPNCYLWPMTATNLIFYLSGLTRSEYFYIKGNKIICGLLCLVSLIQNNKSQDLSILYVSFLAKYQSIVQNILNFVCSPVDGYLRFCFCLLKLMFVVSLCVQGFCGHLARKWIAGSYNSGESERELCVLCDAGDLSQGLVHSQASCT